MTRKNSYTNANRAIILALTRVLGYNQSMMIRAFILSLPLFLSACLENTFYAAEWGQDILEGEAWTTLALQGDAEAQYNVGKLNCCGDRPRYDNVRALFWFCKAARQDQRDAMLEIGYLYEHAHDYEGSIIPRNNAMALAYYKLAVMQGSDEAAAEYTRLATAVDADDALKDDVATLVDAWPNIPCEVYR